MNTMEKGYPESVSQELRFTNVDINEYIYPVEQSESIKCVLDCRYWLNTKKSLTCCVLLLTTCDNRKIKLAVYKNRSTGSYSPTTQTKENFCVRDNLILNDEIYITYSRSAKSDNVYLREIKFIEKE